MGIIEASLFGWQVNETLNVTYTHIQALAWVANWGTLRNPRKRGKFQWIFGNRSFHQEWATVAHVLEPEGEQGLATAPIWGDSKFTVCLGVVVCATHGAIVFKPQVQFASSLAESLSEVVLGPLVLLVHVTELF